MVSSYVTLYFSVSHIKKKHQQRRRGLKSRRSRKLRLFDRILKDSCELQTEKIINAQKFQFSTYVSRQWGFSRPKWKKIIRPKNFPKTFSTVQNLGGALLPRHWISDPKSKQERSTWESSASDRDSRWRPSRAATSAETLSLLWVSWYSVRSSRSPATSNPSRAPCSNCTQSATSLELTIDFESTQTVAIILSLWKLQG